MIHWVYSCIFAGIFPATVLTVFACTKKKRKGQMKKTGEAAEGRADDTGSPVARTMVCTSTPVQFVKALRVAPMTWNMKDEGMELWQTSFSIPQKVKPEQVLAEVEIKTCTLDASGTVRAQTDLKTGQFVHAAFLDPAPWLKKKLACEVGS